MFCFKIFLVFMCCVVWTSTNPAYRQPCPIHGNPINPYLQPLQPQPPIATIPQPYNQPVINQLPPLQQELGQMIVKKLFSNPTLQSILSQNPGSYSHTPNVVNNYFIVPGELFLNNTNKCKREHVKTETAEELRIAEINAINEANKIINEANHIKAMEDRRNEFMRRNHASHFVHPHVRRLYDTGDRNRGFVRRAPERAVFPEENPKDPRIRSRVKENLHTFPNEEEILQDFRSKFPHIPENVARNMLQNMRERVQKQYSNSYRQKSRSNQRGTQRNVNRRRSRNKRPKPKVAESKDDITTSRTVMETTTNPTEVYAKKGEVEATTPFEMPELGSEDELPNIENGLEYDDYYPDFTIDNQAHVLEDMRPYEERSQRRQGRKKNKHLDEEIVYKSPPGLESPDFITTQVNRKYGNLDMKAYRKRGGTDADAPTDRNIETVHAGSKVTNYGVKESDENVYDEPKSISDGTSIVMAKSYGYPEEYAW